MTDPTRQVMRAGPMLPYPVCHASDRSCFRKWGKSPGTQVQHTLEIGTKGTELRHLLAPDCGTAWMSTKFARTFALLTCQCCNLLI